MKVRRGDVLWLAVRSGAEETQTSLGFSEPLVIIIRPLRLEVTIPTALLWTTRLILICSENDVRQIWATALPNMTGERLLIPKSYRWWTRKTKAAFPRFFLADGFSGFSCTYTACARERDSSRVRDGGGGRWLPQQLCHYVGGNYESDGDGVGG